MAFRRFKRKAPIRRRRFKKKVGTVANIDRRVSVLSRQVRGTVKYAQYFWNTNYSNLGAYTIIQPVDPNSMIPTFQKPDLMSTITKVRHRSLSVNMRFTTGNEPSIINFTVMFVQLRPSTAANVLIDTNNLTTLTSGVDYLPYGNSLIHLNQSRFKLLGKPYRFALGDFTTALGTPVTSIRDTQKTIVKKIKLNDIVRTGAGQWKDLDKTELPNYARTAILIWTDNSGADLQYPQVDVNAIINVSSA